MAFKELTAGLILSLSLSSAASEFEQRIEALITDNRLPGMVTLVQRGDEVLHYSAHGKVNLDADERMQKDAIFRIYSMSKPVTAFAVLQLVDKGKLKLSDDIRTHLPGFSPFEYDGREQVVTVHHLLAHTAGMGYGGGFSSWSDIRYLLANPLSRSNTLADLIDDISGIDLKAQPGEKWLYSIASDVQGALVEAVSGKPLDVYLQDNIFQPLGMSDTGFWVTPEKAHRLVDMYEYDADGIVEARAFDADKIEFVESGDDSDFLEKPVLLSGGGGLVSTAKDWAKFVRMLLDGGLYQERRLLSEALVQRMLSSQTQGLDTWFLPKLYDHTGYGYGIGVKEQSGDLRPEGSFYWAGMGGTVFWGDPDNDLLVVAMMQVEDGWIALDRWLVNEVYQLIGSDLGLANASN